MESDFQIDAVISWVDGNDPQHRAKRLAWMNDGEQARHDDIAGETRYLQVGEIAFCVASILRFAPFIRKIFIVTDNQNPKLDDFLAANFPDNQTIIEIVDHKVIFRGYEQMLPTFNSLTIESMLWRIPGLAEHFVYFNDDVVLLSPAERSHFFNDEGHPVSYSYWHKAFTARLLRVFRTRKDGHRKVLFRDLMLNAADAIGAKRFLRIQHTTHSLRRSFFEHFFAEHPDLLERQITHRFRHETQFNPQCLAETALALKDQCDVVSPEGKLIYLQHRSDGFAKPEVLNRFFNDNKALFGCLNALDKANEQSRKQLMEFLEKRLNCSTNPNQVSSL